MLFACTSLRSLRMYRFSMDINPEISFLGRFQFSVENAYKVTAAISNRRQVSMIALTESAPARCPKMRGLPRIFAHRPFPSMMTATCLGRRPGSIVPKRRASSLPLFTIPSKVSNILNTSDPGNSLVGQLHGPFRRRNNRAPVYGAVDVRIDLVIGRWFFDHARYQPVRFYLENNHRWCFGIVPLNNRIELFRKAAMNKPFGLEA